MGHGVLGDVCLGLLGGGLDGLLLLLLRLLEHALLLLLLITSPTLLIETILTRLVVAIALTMI